MSDDLKRLQQELEARDEALSAELTRMRQTLERESRATRKALRRMRRNLTEVARAQIRQTADLDQSLAVMNETLATSRTNAAKTWSALFTVTARHETSLEDLDRRVTDLERKLAG